jgi:hypothetical protein
MQATLYGIILYSYVILIATMMLITGARGHDPCNHINQNPMKDPMKNPMKKNKSGGR